MCGIVYVKRKDGKSAVRSVRKRYYKQKQRGTDGFGYVAIKNNKVVSYQRAATEQEIMAKLNKEDAHEILFHHRFPTSTPNLEEQAHPLLVKHASLSNEYYVAHNGVIRNPFIRKVEHEKLGIKYSTELRTLWATTTQKLYRANKDLKFNDSEALATDTALALEGVIPSIEAEGAAAVIALQVKDGMVTDRIFYRNHLNPLKLKEDNSMLALTSAGLGEDLTPVHVMHLKGDVLEKHPRALFVPLGYRAYTNVGVTRGHYASPHYGPVDDLEYGYSRGDEDDLADYFKNNTQPMLPMPTDVVHGSGVSVFTIRGMNDDVLWEEYDKSLATLKDLEKGIELLDDKVKAGIINEGITGGRLRLQQSFDRTTAYKRQLDAEVSTRIAKNNMNNIRKGGLLTG